METLNNFKKHKKHESVFSVMHRNVLGTENMLKILWIQSITDVRA